jgi:hypothetical protein
MIGLAFLHTWLLAFLALAAIPIIIHLMHRRKFRTVQWAAMEFLLRSTKETARRLKILQLLLLLARIAIILFIVGALARPLLTGAVFAGFLGQSRSASTIILDNSYSMAVQQGNTTAFDTAKEAAQAIASTLRKGDSLSLMTASARPSSADETTRDPELLGRQIARTELSDAGTDTLGALSRCLERMTGLQQSHREIFIVSDCRLEGWQLDDTAAWNRVNKLIEQCDPKPNIFLVAVSTPGDHENVFIESVRLPTTPPAVGHDYAIGCTIRTHAETPGPAPVVTLYLDDDTREADRARGSRFDDGVSTAQFVFRPTEPGWHWGKLTIGPDALPPDNARYFAFEVREALNVLCLDGSPSSRGLESSMSFLRIALAPGKVGNSADTATSPEETSTYASAENIVAPVVAPLSRFWDYDLTDFPAVFVTDAAGFSDAMAASLRGYVHSGGAVVVFPGETVRPARYALLSDPASGRPLLPAQITGTNGTAVELDAPQTPEAVRLADFDFNHPVVRPFEDQRDGDLTSASFYRYTAVVVDEDDPDVRVLMRFDNGDPYLIERRFGQGVVLLFTSSADLRWSNMPLKPVFLPLVHRITYWLAGRGSAARELVAGGTIRQPVPSRLATAELTLERPRGAPETVRPALAGIPGEHDGTKLPMLVYEETDAAGIYTVRGPDDAASGPVEMHVCVNVDPRESDLTPLTPQALTSLFRAAPLEYVAADEDVARVVRTSRHGREMWRYLAVAVCLLLMTESALAHTIDKT